MLKTIFWLTGIITLALAAFAFILSFNALRDLAQQHGVSIPFLFPLVVEAAVIVFSLNLLYRSLTGQGVKLQWVLILLSSLLAVVFNVAHAQQNLVSQFMAAMPSLFLLLSFESLLSLVRYFVQRQNTLDSLEIIKTALNDKNSEVDTLEAKIAKARATLEALTNDIGLVKMQSVQRARQAKQEKIDNRRQSVLVLLNDGYEENDIAEQLKVSVRTIQRDKIALNGQVTA